MPKQKQNGHIHQYVLRPYGKKGLKVYACVLPTCNHYQIQKQLIIGKQALCNQCQEPFIITADIVRDSVVRPRCRDCKKEKRLGGPVKKVTPEQKNLDSAIEDLRNKLNLF